jgi:transcriptional regulator with XRE-family HTH domain
MPFAYATDRTAPNPPDVLRTLRDVARLTSAQLAERIGVSPGSVSAWLSGSTSMKPPIRMALAVALGDAMNDGQGPIPVDLFDGSEADVYRYLTRRLGESRSSHRHLIVA